MKTLIVILGPTGIGKTELSLQVAEHLASPIINADSRQIYAEIPIGTAAPTRGQQARVKHFFVGTHSIDDYYSASMFEEDVLSTLHSLFLHSDTALMCGGSMMYIDAVCNGIDDIPTVDALTRATMKRRLETEGLPTLLAELKALDYEHWKIVDHNNPRRVVHALEICTMTGKTYTSFRQHAVKPRPFHIVKIGLTLPRATLYDRINRRVDAMMALGLEAEARSVYAKRHLNALNTVGYKEMFEHFDGTTTLPEAVFKIKSATRRYCRKQQTWFKRDPSIQWFSPCDIQEIMNYIDETLVGADRRDAPLAREKT